MSSRAENVKWVDGLRGLASVLVIATHIARGFDFDLFKPTSGEGLPPRLLQYPILRVLVQGRIGVCIFALVTGYVCALKPVRLIRGGDRNAAFVSVAKSAFRRVPRLILPTTIATTLAWLFCQFGVFEVGSRVDSWWINFSSPPMTPYVGQAMYSLLFNIITTWTKGWNMYDHHTWTLLPLLRASMLIYIMIVATAYCKARYRMIVELGLFLYCYIGNDPTFGMLAFFGAFLSDLSQHPPHQSWCAARKWPSRILSPLFILFGLLLASYPEAEPQWMTWSRMMGEYSSYIFPRDNETPRFYTAIGLVFITLGIHFSASVKNILSSKYLLWFGKNSFAVYLIHGSLLRSLMVWMYFGIHKPANIIVEGGGFEPGPPLKICGSVRFWFWMPIWLAIVYALASLWTKYVDPWCARVTERLVRHVFEDPQLNLDAEKRLLPQ